MTNKDNEDSGPYGIAYSCMAGGVSWYIPNYMMGGINRYVDQGIPPGNFLTAIICNDLREAVYRADDTNVRNLPAYVMYFYNEVPSPAWGSREKMEKWIEMHAKKREEG